MSGRCMATINVCETVRHYSKREKKKAKKKHIEIYKSNKIYASYLKRSRKRINIHTLSLADPHMYTFFKYIFPAFFALFPSFFLQRCAIENRIRRRTNKNIQQIRHVFFPIAKYQRVNILFVLRRFSVCLSCFRAIV